MDSLLLLVLDIYCNNLILMLEIYILFAKKKMVMLKMTMVRE